LPLRLRKGCGHMREAGDGIKGKSLLVLFFRKELLSYAPAKTII
jgi:hypothetical protein